jgi:acetylglutamate kinase
VNADDAALGVARILHASMLVLLTDVAGILDADGALVEKTDAAGIERLIEGGAITGGMIPKARAAAASAEASGVPTVIASWSRADRLAELARGGLVGTRVLPRRTRPIGPLADPERRAVLRFNQPARPPTTLRTDPCHCPPLPSSRP